MSVKYQRELEEDVFISDDDEEGDFSKPFTDSVDLYQQDLGSPDISVQNAREHIHRLATDISTKIRMPDTNCESYHLPTIDAPISQEIPIINFVLHFNRISKTAPECMKLSKWRLQS